ncbi:hypothetical protein PLICBS_000069 [Purpureocillium lilacinum]|uniref:uncharacterized protein n=1 Tax=Purpureocillium lilacinum TaxID=33203 RepID=UPI0020869730|nr:hypothetical protein PLICBS_000069 [Purpureocillium lilacinum]
MPRRCGSKGVDRVTVGALRSGCDQTEPYIHIRGVDEFADSFEASFFAKAFPTLLPFGFGGPGLAEEATPGSIRGISTRREADGAVNHLISSRNKTLWRRAAAVLRRHGGRFATHHILSFLVNISVRSRNRRISMLSVAKENFGKVERIARSLIADRLAAAKIELEGTGKTTGVDVTRLSKTFSLYGYCQPMSREGCMSMRHNILALMVPYGVPAIWFTVNPNDITDSVNLLLAAYRTRDPDAAEEFLRSLDMSFKRLQLSISDPMSSTMFFHREMALFFEHYAMAEGLRHNHDISFIATQRKTKALVYYVTNYATKAEDPIWKRAAAAADLLPVARVVGVPAAECTVEGRFATGGGGGDGVGNKTRQFLMKVANRVFTERTLSQVEVIADLLGDPVEYTNSSVWAYLNVSLLYWHDFRRWRHLRRESGPADAQDQVDESVVEEEAGQRRGPIEAYPHRGGVLQDLWMYDYASLVKLQRAGKDGHSGA